MAEIVYPQGCRPITDDLGADELVRRLKVLAHTLQGLGQDEGMYQQYIPLALHLADEFFLTHASRDVQLLIACCIADVLRVYAPEAPYKDQEQVKTIFLFLIKQLQGLRDPKDPAFKRYFYLLENLAYVKSFNMCFELEDCQEIFCALFSLMFRIVNTEHSTKVKSFMLDVLCPLITESDVVSNELLNVILTNLVEPNKREHKYAYALAKELIVKTSETLEPYIQAFFNHVLILGKEEKELLIFSKVYELIYELYQCCPALLLSVLPQLECKLKSAQFQERLSGVALLARMFSEPGSELAKQYPGLWRAFLGRFNDLSVPIRIKCVQYCMHFLVHHPDLRKDITETLKMRQHDAHEQVRYEVVMAIIATAQKDFQAVAESEDLLHFVRERTLDKKFKIRKEAMSGLAMIYKKFLTEESVPPATEIAVRWIKDKILHGYYMTALEDRLLVERLLNTSLVPYTLPASVRMKKLYYLMSNVDDNATKAFIELQKHQLAVRRTVAEWIELHRKPPTPAVQKKMISKVLHISSKFLPESVKAQEFLNKFSLHMKQAPELLQGMETILNPNVSCEVCVRTTSSVLKKLGQPVMTNLYYNTVKMLLERVSSVMIDHESLLILVGYVDGAVKGTDQSLAEECGIDIKKCAERGLKLLVMLSFVFPAHFLHEDVLNRLTNLLELDDESVAPHILAALTFLGKYRPLSDACPALFPKLITLCKAYAEVGTPKQAKNAVRCLFVNVPEQRTQIFTEILETLKATLSPHSEHYRTAIVTLGHVAHNLPDNFPVHIKNIVSRKIVKELLVREGGGGPNAPQGDWCKEEDLPEETRCKLEGLKCMARWLLGLKKDELSAQKTFRMLNAFIVHKGDLLQQNQLSKAEMAHLRLAAGAAMLKICEQKGVGDQFTAEQFYNLSHLMIDEVPQVRELFATKLHKGLSKGIPNKCLPLDFMGMYALAGREPDRRIRSVIRQFMLADVVRRREYIRNITVGTKVERAVSQLPHILPDYMLVFAVPVLTHDPAFTAYDNVAQLKVVKQCLWFILEPLITRNDFYCYGFYKSLVERMKNHKDALNETDDAVNYKLWAVCDLAMSVIWVRSSSFELGDFLSDARIPTMYFAPQSEYFVNTRVFLPPELQFQPKRTPTTTEVPAPRGKKRPRASPADESSVDAEPSEASDTQIQLPGLEQPPETDLEEPQAKRTISE
ncbi:sister chromatid cohesion protein PDS5 homolog B-B isoform X2 [Ostrinia furnacalis]|uniref:sister chromatid cohesion protein PDS5 homolog B-B isoform X1 n=2 Tax=Ostrinia furnacalis TaxID=93504 RepID=UPI00103CA31A|nr:sister chromatid cohesion protein PDS5 homolog B-B isoform X1 [Ostrinia furnacalis]XP_028176871.1 sister chromatid cohesion protein PDS5 homolog B-B isoform X2 [Ostrinia furnacalis]